MSLLLVYCIECCVVKAVSLLSANEITDGYERTCQCATDDDGEPALKFHLPVDPGA